MRSRERLQARRPVTTASDRALATSVAAATASRTRPDRAHLGASPAAVVPPGDVTAARSASGPRRSARAASPNRAVSASTSRAATGRGRPTSTPASMSASATSITYAGPGARQAGDGVELRLVDAHDDADRAEQPLGELEVLVGRRSRRARSRTRRARRAQACSASPARPAGPARPLRASRSSRRPRSRARARRAGSAGERGLERRGDVARLHRDDDDVGVGRPPTRALGTTRTLGNCASSSRRRSASISATASRRRRTRRRAGRRRAPRPSCPPPSSATQTTSRRGVMPHCKRRRRLDDAAATRAERRDEARGTIRIASHFPERSGPPAPRAPRLRHRSTPAQRSTRQLHDILT